MRVDRTCSERPGRRLPPSVVNGPHIATEPVLSAGYTVPIAPPPDWRQRRLPLRLRHHPAVELCAHSRVYEAYFYLRSAARRRDAEGGAAHSSARIWPSNPPGSARNVASVISGDTVHITLGAVGAGAFDNQDFHLERTYLRKVLWTLLDQRW